MTTVTRSYWPADTSAQVSQTTVGGILRAAAEAGPDLPAMVGGLPDPGARRRWTYAELLAEAERAARALTARFEPGERLAPYKTPVHWVFVDAFPMTPSGKIQKFKLRESFTGDQPG
jgi:fatty-acyl-CoA synthase